MTVPRASWNPSSLPTASQHLVLSSGATKTLCGSKSPGGDLDIGFVDLSDAALRDHVCRACLREWLKAFAGGSPPAWASEVLE